MALVCDPDVLSQSDACFDGPCLGLTRQRAILIYLMAKEYEALGGVTDYSDNVAQLQIDSKAWQKIPPGSRFAALLEIYRQNAITAGATGLDSKITIAEAAACFDCIPDQDNAILYLTCLLGVHAAIT